LSGIKESTKEYLEELREDGLPIPEPTTTVTHISVAA
jgi:predicted RNase H-like HicB family nuclease